MQKVRKYIRHIACTRVFKVSPTCRAKQPKYLNDTWRGSTYLVEPQNNNNKQASMLALIIAAHNLVSAVPLGSSSSSTYVVSSCPEASKQLWSHDEMMV